MAALANLTAFLLLALFALAFSESLETVEHTKSKFKCNVCYRDNKRIFKQLKKLCSIKYIDYCPFETKRVVCIFKKGKKICSFKVVNGIQCTCPSPSPTPSNTPTPTPSTTSTPSATPTPSVTPSPSKVLCKPTTFEGGYGRFVYKFDVSKYNGKLPFFYSLKGSITVKVVYKGKTIFKYKQKKGKVIKTGVIYYKQKRTKKIRIVIKAKYPSKWVFVVKCPY